MVRLPDDSAGKSVPCPRCAAPIAVPGGLFAPTPMAPAPGLGDNPYSAPQTSYVPPTFAATGGPISNQVVDAGAVISHAWKIWTENLGLLVGVTLVIVVIGAGFYFGSQQLNAALLAQRVDPLTVIFVDFVVEIASNVIHLFLGIGETLLILKLLRGQPASFGDLFSGGPRFWPALGIAILSGLLYLAGFLLCVIPFIILVLIFWPVSTLVIDNKTGVFDSFSVASSITQGNRLTTFVLFLASIGISLLGVLACGVGVLFALPLISVMWVTAYMMMSGQLSAQQYQPSYGPA
jgi:hypothetical protein